MTPEDLIAALDVPVAVTALLYTLHRLLTLAKDDLAAERERQDRLLEMLERCMQNREPTSPPRNRE